MRKKIQFLLFLSFVFQISAQDFSTNFIIKNKFGSQDTAVLGYYSAAIVGLDPLSLMAYMYFVLKRQKILIVLK